MSLLYTLLSVIRIDRTDDVSQFLEPFILLYFLERLRDQKIAVLSGQTENWNCKSWENARTGHTERSIFYSIWFINESTFLKNFETRQ